MMTIELITEERKKSILRSQGLTKSDYLNFGIYTGKFIEYHVYITKFDKILGYFTPGTFYEFRANFLLRDTDLFMYDSILEVTYYHNTVKRVLLRHKDIYSLGMIYDNFIDRNSYLPKCEVILTKDLKVLDSIDVNIINKSKVSKTFRLLGADYYIRLKSMSNGSYYVGIEFKIHNMKVTGIISIDRFDKSVILYLDKKVPCPELLTNYIVLKTALLYQSEE